MANYGHVKEQQPAADGPAPWKRFFAIACLISVSMSAFTILQSHAQYGTNGTWAPSLSWTLVTNALVSRSTADAHAHNDIPRRDWTEVMESAALEPGEYEEDQAELTRDIFLITHLTFSFVVAFYVVPVALGLESTRNILDRLRMPHVLPSIPHWINFLWLGIIAPSLVIVPVSGMLATDTFYFHVSNGVLGQVSLLSGMTAVTLHYLVRIKLTEDLPTCTCLGIARNIVNPVFLLLSITATAMGFIEPDEILAYVTQKFPPEYVIISGFGFTCIMIIVPVVYALDKYLAFRESSSSSSMGDSDAKEML